MNKPSKLNKFKQDAKICKQLKGEAYKMVRKHLINEYNQTFCDKYLYDALLRQIEYIYKFGSFGMDKLESQFMIGQEVNRNKLEEFRCLLDLDGFILETKIIQDNFTLYETLQIEISIMDMQIY